MQHEIVCPRRICISRAPKIRLHEGGLTHKKRYEPHAPRQYAQSDSSFSRGGYDWMAPGYAGFVDMAMEILYASAK